MIDFAAENRRGYWGFTDGHQFASNFEGNEIDGIEWDCDGNGIRGNGL